MDTIAQIYPIFGVDKSVNKNNKDYIYTTVIFKLIEDILNQLSDLSVNFKKQKIILECFIKAMQRKTSQSFKILKFNLTDIKFL